MAKYPLAQLLTAREIREEAAARETRRALREAEEARERAEAARRESARYREWRPGEEQRLFEKIRDQHMPLSGIDRHREDIQALKNAELALEEAAAEADKAVSAAEAAAKKARLAQAAAARDRQKIEEHRERWQKAENKRIDAAEEAELEDFPAGNRNNGEE